MRIFQSSGITQAYRCRLTKIAVSAKSFAEKRDAFLNDRFGAPHILLPVLRGDASAFFTNANDEDLQRTWAREQGMPSKTPLLDILLAQVEHHRTEVMYNLDPITVGDNVIRRLPSSVKRTIAWRAAPSGGAHFLTHDLIVNNFPHLLDEYRRKGVKASFFFPAHDPVFDEYADKTERSIDIFFAGGYSRHHIRRNETLNLVAKLRSRFNVVFCINTSRFTRLAESPLGLIGPLRKHRRPASMRAVSCPPKFGRSLYEFLGKSKIVINGAIDMAGPDRGNIRVWEAMGAGAALVSDEGNYPEGFRAGENFISYKDDTSLLDAVEQLLEDDTRRVALAAAGNRLIRRDYDKARQWSAFQILAE